MTIFRGDLSLCYRRIGSTELGVVSSLELEQVERFLEPLPHILAAVRRGAAHSLVGVEAGGELVGFFVVHPDERDASCWWLGWLAIDRRWQGQGLGRAALTAALERLWRIAGCRRVRLLVARENAPALRLYEQAGFQVVGRWAATDELVMERPHVVPLPSATVDAVIVAAPGRVAALQVRLWRRGVPPAARLSGEFHGPPPFALAFGQPSRVSSCPVWPCAVDRAA